MVTTHGHWSGVFCCAQTVIWSFHTTMHNVFWCPYSVSVGSGIAIPAYLAGNAVIFPSVMCASTPRKRSVSNSSRSDLCTGRNSSLSPWVAFCTKSHSCWIILSTKVRVNRWKSGLFFSFSYLLSWSRSNDIFKLSVLKYYCHSATVTIQCSLWNIQKQGVISKSLLISLCGVFLLIFPHE